VGGWWGGEGGGERERERKREREKERERERERERVVAVFCQYLSGSALLFLITDSPS
jgi:hypothetical protein